jgi:isorenieratene synthase
VSRLRLFGRVLPPRPAVSDRPDWVQADPRWIQGALDRALRRPGGGWLVVDASRRIGSRPRRYTLMGKEWVAWRAAGRVHLAPDRCPHLGASLAGSRVEDGALVCPWHGLRLSPAGHGPWRCVDTHDDGVLAWARLVDDEEPGEEPVLPVRPRAFLEAVIRHEARCAVDDVLANRLDPWHGAHFHPYSFARLKVVEQEEDSVTVRVVYRVLGPWGVEVDARFHCPDPRSIVMTIVDGEGEGSVVETHATPVAPGRVAVVEATLAASDRPAFARATRATAFLLRPLIRWAAGRLWVDDAAYAERRYALRMRSRKSAP